MSRVWFVTGATRGIGSESAKAALASRNKIAATGRNPEAVRKALDPSEHPENDSGRQRAHSTIVTGLIAHTCVESTVRFAAELGYDMTLVKDAIADYADEFMHAALVINLPNYASAIMTTQEVIDSISSVSTAAA